MLKWLICVFIAGHDFDHCKRFVVTNDYHDYGSKEVYLWCKRCNKYRMPV